MGRNNNTLSGVVSLRNNMEDPVEQTMSPNESQGVLSSQFKAHLQTGHSGEMGTIPNLEIYESKALFFKPDD